MGVTVRQKPKGSDIWWVFIHQNGHKRSKKIGTKNLAEAVAERLRAKSFGRWLGREAMTPKQLSELKGRIRLTIDSITKQTHFTIDTIVEVIQLGPHDPGCSENQLRAIIGGELSRAVAAGTIQNVGKKPIGKNRSMKSEYRKLVDGKTESTDRTPIHYLDHAGLIVTIKYQRAPATLDNPARRPLWSIGKIYGDGKFRRVYTVPAFKTRQEALSALEVYAEQHGFGAPAGAAELEAAPVENDERSPLGQQLLDAFLAKHDEWEREKVRYRGLIGELETKMNELKDENFKLRNFAEDYKAREKATLGRFHSLFPHQKGEPTT